MALDSKTLLILSTLICLALGVGCVVLSRARSRVEGYGEWGAALIALGLGSALAGLRGVLSDALSLSLANALVMGGCGLCWVGARRFGGRPARLWTALPAPLLWLALRQVPGVLDTVEARVILASLLCGPLLLAAGLAFWRAAGIRWGLRLFLSLSFTLHGLLVLGRVPFALLRPQWQAGSQLPSDMAVQLVMLLTALQGIGTTMALLLATRERQDEEIRLALATARDAAQQANAAKSRFLARMSHELRTPLNGVLGLSQALRENGALPPAAREQAAVIGRAGQHMLSLVNDVLDIALVEAGRLTLREEAVAVRPLLEEALELLRPEIQRKTLTVETEVAAEAAPSVRADHRRLRQILLNLLGNAVKYTPPRGQVRLVVRPLAPQGLRISIIDSGPGIPPDQQARLFAEFSRLDSAESLTASQEGHGLGLAICAGLTQAMGGRIGVAAGVAGLGSHFWVELPLQPSTPPRTAAAQPPPSVMNGLCSVLVVDDVAVNRMVAQALLQAAGHVVWQAASGEAALALLAREPVDLVLMDVQMPGMSGLEATRHIRAAERADPSRRRIGILALTGELEQENVDACLAAGMDGHLAKPVDRQSLLAAVQRWPAAGSPAMPHDLARPEPQRA